MRLRIVWRLIIGLLHIYMLVQEFWNQSTFGKIISKTIVAPFFWLTIYDIMHLPVPFDDRQTIYYN